MKWRKPADGEGVKGNPPDSEGGRYTGGLAGALPPNVGKKKAPKWEQGLWLTAKRLNHDALTS